MLNRWWLPEGEHLRSYPLTRTSTSKGSNHIYPATFFRLTHSEIRRMEKVTLRRYSLYVREGRSAPVHHEPKRAPYVVRPLRGRWKEDEITRRCSPSGSHQRLSTVQPLQGCRVYETRKSQMCEIQPLRSCQGRQGRNTQC